MGFIVTMFTPNLVNWLVVLRLLKKDLLQPTPSEKKFKLTFQIEEKNKGLIRHRKCTLHNTEPDVFV